MIPGGERSLPDLLGKNRVKYDGYAWYRVMVNIPSGLKKMARKYGKLTLRLARIDDVDFTYFNGKSFK